MSLIKINDFLQQKNEDLNLKYMELVNMISESKEFQDIQNQINDYEKNLSIEYEGNIKELIKIINDVTYGSYNVSGRYYLEDIKEEDIEFR